MNAVNKRIQEYDVAKGIGIILVMLGHALPEENYWRLVIYSFHMPLFFSLSGIVLKVKEGSSNLKDGVFSENKLFSNYIFYSAVFLIFDIVVRLIVLQKIGIRGIIWDCYQTVTFYGINVLWFLASLMIGKIIVKRLLALESVRGLRAFIIVLFLFFIPCILSNNIFKPETGWQRLIWYPLMAILRAVAASSFILSGYLMKNRIQNVFYKENTLNIYKIFKYIFLTILPTCIILISCYFLNHGKVIIDMHVMDMGILPVTFMLSYVGIIGILGWSSILCKFRQIRNFFLFWGFNSLFVMATHEYLMIKDILTWILNCFDLDIDNTVTPIMYILWGMIIEAILIKLLSKRTNLLIHGTCLSFKLKNGNKAS